MLFVVPYLLYKSDEEFFKRYFVSTFISITVAGLIYIFFPTSIVRASINGSGITNFIVKFIYLIDTPVMNCFPSMHCIISFLFIQPFEQRPHWLNFLRTSEFFKQVC